MFGGSSLFEALKTAWQFDQKQRVDGYLDAVNEEPEVIDEIVVSPNPYYDNSNGGDGNAGDEVSIANLPKGAIVTVYTFDGTLVRQFSEKSGAQYIDRGTKQELKWDLLDLRGVRIPAGMYIINVIDPIQRTQKSIQWVKI